MEKINYIPKTYILKRDGWTKKAMNIFLQNPDLIKTNPNYKSGPPMQLFLLEKIEKIEQTVEFKEFVNKNKNKKHKIGAQKSLKTKIDKITNWAETVEIIIPNYSIRELKRLSIQHYNDYHFEDGAFVTKNDDADFILRITYNFIRHVLTNYETLLYEIHGKVGTDDAYDILRERIDNAIELKYPANKIIF